MINQISKLSVGIAALFEIILMLTAIASIAARQWKHLSLTILAMVCLMIPFTITRIANIKNITLPSGFPLMMLVFIFLAQYLGEIRNFYQIFWWWDLLLHALFIMKGIIRMEQETTDHRFALFALLFAFSFSITLGTLWEMFEFTGDYILKSNMVKGGLEDTSTDLLMKILAAFITSVICYYQRKKKL